MRWEKLCGSWSSSSSGGQKGAVHPCQVPVNSLALLLSVFSSFCPEILDSEFMLDHLLGVGWGWAVSDICVYNVKKRSRKISPWEGKTISLHLPQPNPRKVDAKAPQEPLLFGRRGDVCKVDEPGMYIALPIEGVMKRHGQECFVVVVCF